MRKLKNEPVLTTLTLTEELLNRIEKLADRQKRLPSQVIEFLLDEFLKKYRNVEPIDLPFDVPRNWVNGEKVRITIALEKPTYERMKEYRDEMQLNSYQILAYALKSYLEQKGGRT